MFHAFKSYVIIHAIIYAVFLWFVLGKGLRVSMLLACFVMAAGAGLRCIGLYDFDNFQWLVPTFADILMPISLKFSL